MASLGRLAGRLNLILEGALVRAWAGDALSLANAADVILERLSDQSELV